MLWVGGLFALSPVSIPRRRVLDGCGVPLLMVGFRTWRLILRASRSVQSMIWTLGIERDLHTRASYPYMHCTPQPSRLA